MFLWLLTFYQTGPNGLFIFYQVFNLILQSALNKKVIKIGYSPLGKNNYQYNIVAIANEDFKSWHNTYLFCLMKNKPVILLDQSKNANPVIVKVVKDKELNKNFSKIYTEK